MSAPHRRRRGVVSRVLGAAAVCALSLAIVIAPTSTPAANAFAGPLIPIALRTGAGLFSAPLKNIAVGGALVKGGSLGLGALGVGAAAYGTQDHWIPLLQDALGGEGGTISLAPDAEGADLTEFGGPAVSCGISSGGVTPLGTAYPNAFKFNVSWGPGDSCPTTKSVYAKYEGVACRTPAGDIIAGVGGPWRAIGSANPSTGTASFNTIAICGADQIIVSALLRVVLTKGDPRGASAPTLVPIPTGGWNPDEHTSTVYVQCESADGTKFTVKGTEVGKPERLGIPSCRAVDPTSRPLRGNANMGPSVDSQTPALTFSMDGVKDEYGDCFTMVGLVCQIKVHYNDAPCNASEPACVDWQRTLDANPNLVRCKFGGYVIPMPNCNPLKHSYVPNGNPTYITNPTWPQPDPNPTPNPNPNPNPSPNPTPTPNPTPAPDPFDPTRKNPNPDGPAARPDETTDPDSQGCFGEAVSLNPVDWVYVPVKCAVIWAFRPPTSIQSRLDTITRIGSDRIPLTWVRAIGGIPDGVPQACPDWSIDVGGRDRVLMCDQPFTDALRSARPLIAALMVSAAVWPLIRSTAYASVPIVKPSPTA